MQGDPFLKVGIEPLRDPLRPILRGLNTNFYSDNAGSALNLNFSNGSNVLDPKVTFSRTSNGMTTNSSGLVTYAPQNLLTHSEQFDNAAWAKTESTVTANQIASPAGTTTADKFVPSVNAVIHNLQNTITATTAQLTGSVYVKLDGSAVNKVTLYPGASATFANFDLSAMTASWEANVVTASITAVGNDWYRLTATWLASVAVDRLRIYASSGSIGASPTAGNGTSGIYIWGAQLELGSTATTYNPTTVKNLLGYTEHFDNAAWTKSNATITSGFTDIYGQPFAQKLVENTANNVHSVNIESTTIVGTPYTVSVCVKAAERSWCVVQIQSAVFAYVNLTTGAVGTTNGSPTVVVTSVGNGWYRIAVTSVAVSTALSTVIYAATGNGTVSYTGDGTSGIYIFGAQLSDSASVDPYVYNPVAAPTAQAYYGPRFDYDPVTLAPKGLLIEEQRTNQNWPSASNTFITNWSLAVGSATRTANYGIAPDGTATTTYVVQPATAQYRNFTTVSIPANTAYVISFFATSAAFRSATVSATYGRFNRYVLTGTSGASTLTFVDIIVDGAQTFEIWGIQIEAGAFATRYIPTVASQVTRAADSASMIGNNFARWFNQTEGSFFTSVDTFAPTAGDKRVIGLNGTACAFPFISSAAKPAMYDGTALDVGALVSANAVVKIATAYDATTKYGTSAGASVASSSRSATFPLTPGISAHIGSQSGTSAYLNGHVQRIAYYPRRLANTELQGITS